MLFVVGFSRVLVFGFYFLNFKPHPAEYGVDEFVLIHSHCPDAGVSVGVNLDHLGFTRGGGRGLAE